MGDFRIRALCTRWQRGGLVNFLNVFAHRAKPSARIPSRPRAEPINMHANIFFLKGALAALTNDEGKLPSTIAFERGASEDMIAFFLKKMEEENREKCDWRSRCALFRLWLL